MSDNRRLRITSDGDDCRVVDMETGNPLRHVVSVEWKKASFEDVSVATVTTLLIHIDMVTGASVVRVCPECGRESGEGETSPPPRPGERQDFHLDDRVRFRPTKRGLAIWRDHHREAQMVVCHPAPLRLDKDGRITESLWLVMQVYGPHIGCGLESPIEAIELVRRA